MLKPTAEAAYLPVSHHHEVDGPLLYSFFDGLFRHPLHNLDHDLNAGALGRLSGDLQVFFQLSCVRQRGR